MGDIKSAREIALEKASKLGKLKREEIAKYQQEKVEQIVKALMEKYLTIKDSRLIETELNKYKTEEQALIKELICRHLLDLLTINNQNLFDIIYQGFISLDADSRILDRLDKIRKYFTEYSNEYNSEKEKIDRTGYEVFQKKGISGSAVSVNTEVNPEWKNRLDNIAAKYEESIKDLKQQITIDFQSE